MHPGPHRSTCLIAIVRAVAIAAVFTFPMLAVAATEVRIWHSLTGVSAQTFESMVAAFNAEQKNYHVDLVYKGDDRATTLAGIAAMSLPDGPDLLQAGEGETGDVLGVRNGIKPIYDILPLAKSKDFDFFIPGAVAFIKDDRNRLRAFPLEASVPVLMYNLAAYAKAGLPTDAPPATWRDLQKQLITLQDFGKGMKCSYTSSDPTWIHIENLSALHGETIATKNNGLDGPGAALTFNDLLHVRHIALMTSWVKSELYHPSGHGEEGDARFASGECGVLTTASGSLGDIATTAKFGIGVAPLPFYEEGAHQSSTLIGGSALWAVEGRTRDVYNGIAAFLAYLATPVVAVEWHQKTGSLPWTSAAYLVSQRTGFYDKYPGLATVMKGATATLAPTSRGIRLPNYDKVRAIIDQQLDAVWSGEKPPKLGLDDAVRLGDIAMQSAATAAPPPPKSKAAKIKDAVKKVLKKT